MNFFIGFINTWIISAFPGFFSGNSFYYDEHQESSILLVLVPFAASVVVLTIHHLTKRNSIN